MAVPANVRVAAHVSPEDVRQLLDDFRSIGLDPTARVVPTRRGLSDFPWLVVVTLPLQLFLSTLMQELAGDAYTRLKALVGRVLHHEQQRDEGRRVLVFQDTATGAQVVLEHDLPPEGYRQLFRVDLAALTHGPLHYDRSKHEWRSELDEWERQNPPP